MIKQINYFPVCFSSLNVKSENIWIQENQNLKKQIAELETLINCQQQQQHQYQNLISASANQNNNIDIQKLIDKARNTETELNQLKDQIQKQQPQQTNSEFKINNLTTNLIAQVC